MSTRLERRKEIRKAGAKNKTLAEWKKEFMALPAEVGMLLIALREPEKVSPDFYKKVKEKYPQYWNEQDVFEPIKFD